MPVKTNGKIQVTVAGFPVLQDQQNLRRSLERELSKVDGLGPFEINFNGPAGGGRSVASLGVNPEHQRSFAAAAKLVVGPSCPVTLTIIM